jgi:hypothetical protein
MSCLAIWLDPLWLYACASVRLRTNKGCQHWPAARESCIPIPASVSQVKTNKVGKRTTRRGKGLPGACYYINDRLRRSPSSISHRTHQIQISEVLVAFFIEQGDSLREDRRGEHVLPGEVRDVRQVHVGRVRPPRRVRAPPDPRGPALRLPRLAGGRPRRRQGGGGGGRLRHRSRIGGVFVHLRLHHPVMSCCVISDLK